MPKSRILSKHQLPTGNKSTKCTTEQLRHNALKITPKRINWLPRLTQLLTIYPSVKTLPKEPKHKIDPYLLSYIQIDRADQVWSAGITCIRRVGKFIYLMAIVDWHSSYVISWSASTSLESLFRLDALDEALAKTQPEMFHTNRDSQFTSKYFTRRLARKGVQIGMDGHGEVSKNVLDPLWQAVKCEELCLREYLDVTDVLSCLRRYFEFYNHNRPHQSLDSRTPAMVYFGHKERQD